MGLRVLVTTLLTGTLSCSFAVAAPSGLPEGLRACAQEKDDSLRLACFDREMAHAEKSAEKSYGLSDEQKRKLQPPPTARVDAPIASRADATTTQVPSAKVLAVTVRADGRTAITLDNGQTWVQGDAFEHIAVQAGDAVTIKPGLLGSLYMYLPSKSRTRVTRER
jgi:hypothetical protein